MMTHSKIRVLFGWNVKPPLQEYIKKHLGPSISVIFPPDNKAETLEKAIETADILVSWNLKETMLQKAHRLKLVIIPAVGIDKFLPVLRKFPELTVANSHGNSATTAQHAIALLLALTNQIVLFDKRMREGKWKPFDDKPPSLFLNNLTIGILGIGRVGTGIRRRLAGFPVGFIGCSRSGKRPAAFPNMITFSSNHLKDFLKRSDILMVTVPLTKETKGLIGRDELSLLPDGALLVNIARGAIIQEDALYDYLSTKRLRGAALDVWYDYDPPADKHHKRYPFTKPFHLLDNVVLSPHRGGSPLDRPERYNDILETILRWSRGLTIENQIDIEKGY